MMSNHFRSIHLFNIQAHDGSCLKASCVFRNRELNGVLNHFLTLSIAGCSVAVPLCRFYLPSRALFSNEVICARH